MKHGVVRAVFIGAMVIAMVAGLGAGAGAGLSTTGYPIKDLGIGVANDINNKNQVVGTLVTGGGDCHAFVWQNDAMRDLDLRVGGTSFAQAINYSGQVVGGRASGAQMQACRWQPDGTPRDLGFLHQGDTWSYARDINSSGQVVGFSGTGTWSIARDTFSLNPGAICSSFLWDIEHGMQELTYITSPSSAYGINDAGSVVGVIKTGPGADDSRGFLWEHDGDIKITILGSYNGSSSGAYAVNNQGQIAGSTGYPGGSAGFLWDNGTMYIMPQGYNESAIGINNEGAVVGLYGGASNYSNPYVGGVYDGHAYLHDLGTFGDDTHSIYYATYADAINDLYVEVGSVNRQGIQHATLWGTVPEPSSLLALLSGLVGMGGTVWRRRKQAQGISI